MDIVYRLNASLEASRVADLFHNSGIRRPVDDLPRIQRMVENANLTLTAWDADKLVGIARAVTDFSYCCYLSDLAVDRAYQRKGIGKELIRRMRQLLGDEVMMLLLAAPEAMEYYPHIGFEKVENAWRIPRK